MANNSEQLFGDYGSNVVPQFTTTPYQGLQKMATNTTYASGCDDTKCQTYQPYDVMHAASGADVIIVCLGTGQALESEGNDRRYLDLPGHQLQLLQDVVKYSSGERPEYIVEITIT